MGNALPSHLEIVIADIAYYCHDTRRLVEADIEIANGHISAIVPPGTSQCKARIDGRGKVALPGVVNSHLHPSKELYGGLTPFDDISQVLDKVHKNNTLETPEVQKTASQYCLAKALKSGVTSSALFTSRAEIDAAAAMDVGVRAVVQFAQNDQWSGKESKPQIGACDAILERYHQCVAQYESALITVHPATASEMSASTQLLEALHAVAKAENKTFSMHIHEGKHQVDQAIAAFSQSGISRLHDLGLLDDTMLLIHACHLDEQDLQQLKQSDTRLVHCPISNSFTGAGTMPVAQLYHDRLIGLGTDAAMVNPSNSIVQDAWFALYCHGTDNLEDKLNPDQLIDMMTCGAAAAIGLNNCGKIAPGYTADIALYQKSDAFFAEQTSLAMLQMQLQHQPTDVMVAGLWPIKDGRFTELDFNALENQFNHIKHLMGKN